MTRDSNYRLAQCSSTLWQHYVYVRFLLTTLLFINISLCMQMVMAQVFFCSNVYQPHSFLSKYRNKWVLKTTAAPLFFLFTQLVIAVILFIAAHASRLLVVPLYVDTQLLIQLAPNIALNVIGLRYDSPMNQQHQVLTSIRSSCYQLQQLYPQVCRRICLPSRAWSRPPLHSPYLLLLPLRTAIPPHSI